MDASGPGGTTGLDVGGTKILGVSLGVAGEVLAERRIPTPGDPEALVGALAEVATDLGDSRAVGVGAAGLIDSEGVVRFAPNIPAFRDFPLRRRLEQQLDRPVVVENDANAAAWAEVAHGAARGRRHVLVVTLGTGIGGGIVVDGSLHRGAHGFAAEVGHFRVSDDGPTCACGARGHWEAIASGRALGRLARERAESGRARRVLELAGSDPGRISGELLGEAALAGDGEALEVLAEFADRVGVGLAGLANILDPEMIVVGGGLVALGDMLLVPVRDAFHRHLLAPDHRPEIPLESALLGERAGAIGAAALARDSAAR